MPINVFPGKTKVWLEERLDAINDALDGGSQTRVALAPGMADEFSGLSAAELRKRRDEYLYALHLLDPVSYANPYDRPGWTRQVFQ